MGKNKYHTTWHNDNINTARSKNMKSKRGKPQSWTTKPNADDKFQFQLPAKDKKKGEHT